MSKNKKTSIGGQALIEGIMMRGPSSCAMAVRNPQGEIVIEKEELNNKTPLIYKIPFIRGIFNMISSLTSGYKYLMRSAEIAGLEDENDEKSSGFLSVIVGFFAVVFGIAISIGLFIFLPSLLYNLIAPVFKIENNQILRSVFEGVLRIIIFICYLLLTLLMKDMRRTFMYHGAEHKTIICYENGLELTVENVRNQCRFHPRCGTSFIILVLIVGIIVAMFIPISNPWLRTVVKLLCLPIVVGVGYELIKLAGRYDNFFTKIISAPGVLLQHITTIEPDDSMIECAIAAFNEVVPKNGENDNW